jgi:hypothetical protein
MKNFLHKTILMSLVIHLGIITNIYATSVNASTYGWNATDATVALRNAMKSAYDTIIVDLQAGDWLIKPLEFDSLANKTIIFQPGVNVVAKPGAFSYIYAVLLRFNESDNINLIGYGATLKMQKSEYIAYNNSEYRHCLSLNSCNNFKIYGFRIMDSGGDGIYVGAYTFPYKTFSENILLKDIWCDNNFRQGISVTSVQHLRVERCWFTNTKGTPPAYGVDLEPFRISQRLVDVVFDKCRFKGNAGGGILVIPLDLDSTSIPIDITFKNCYIDGNGVNRYEIKIGGSTANVAKSAPGIVKFENCMTNSNSETAVGITKFANGYKAFFNNCVFINSTYYPINFDDYSTAANGIRFGGVSFTNCLVSYNTNTRFLNAWSANPTSAGMGDVQVNNLTVINPNNVPYFPGGNPAPNCVFNFQKFTTTPVTNVIFTAGNNLIECNKTNSMLQAARDAGSNISYPIGIDYTLKGTGVQGIDYSRTPMFEIIPMGSYTATDTILVLTDNIAEPLKYDTLSLNANPYFSTNYVPQKITIADSVSACAPVTIPVAITIFSVYPNPASTNITVNTGGLAGLQYIQIYNAVGQFLKEVEVLQMKNISIMDLPNGLYFIRLKNNSKSLKFIKQLF